jgi:uncharacterized protein (DUF169 family)
MEKIENIPLELPPIGIKFLNNEQPGFSGIPRFTGISYCQAILQSTRGRELIIDSASIQVCQWSPVVLGLKEPENEFEKTIPKRLPDGIGAVLSAPIDTFKDHLSPDIVIIRARVDTFRAIIDLLGYDQFIAYSSYGKDETALSLFAEGPGKGFRQWAIININRWLYWMNQFVWWQKLTTILFRSTTITSLFDRLITKYMANMSLCRNSTVIPYQSGRVNISFFCTGAISWGKNSPDFMTSGFPYELYKKIEGHLFFPGSTGYSHESAISD